MGTVIVGNDVIIYPDKNDILQTPTEEEELFAVDGHCFMVESENPESCFQIHTVDTTCFFIDKGPFTATVTPPRTIDIEDMPNYIHGLHVQGHKMYILNRFDSTISIWDIVFDYLNNKVLATYKVVLDWEKPFDQNSFDIYATSNMDSFSDIFIGRTYLQTAPFGKWYDSLIATPQTDVIGGFGFAGKSGDILVSTGSAPTYPSTLIGCSPTAGGGFPELGSVGEDIRNLDDPSRGECREGRVTYEWAGIHFWTAGEVPATYGNAYHIAQVQHIFAHWYEDNANNFVAGFGIAYNKNYWGNETWDQYVVLGVGGQMGFGVFNTWEQRILETNPVLTTCERSYQRFNTQKILALPNVKSYSPDKYLEWYISKKRIMFVGTLTYQDNSTLYGLHYYDYTTLSDGRTEGELKFKAVEWESEDYLTGGPSDCTLYNDMFMYSWNIDVEGITQQELRWIELD